MRKRAAVLACLVTGIVVGVLGVTSTAGADCATSECRADVGMWGASYPDWIHPRQTSLLYFYAKDNGPNSAYGIDVHINVPYNLRIVYARAYSSAQQCTVKGTFINCYMGNFRREQLANVVVKVKPRGPQATYEIPAQVYSQGVVDPNGGNNQTTVTLAVWKN